MEARCFLGSMRIDDRGCWNWLGGRNKKGYGIIQFMGKGLKAHRVSMHCFRGFDLKSPLLVLHRCDNPACFNPKHLFTGDIADNNRDMAKKKRHFNNKKTHCPQGHAFSSANTYIDPEGHRACRSCQKVSRLAYEQRIKSDHIR